NRRRFFIAYSY
ncbi:hypothetical protein ECEC1846_1801, partial [Escherichia coli EC1846]